MEQNPSQVSCPKCGSHDLHADKKGFSGKKAVAGAVLTGGLGLLAGTIGSNKITITCLNCGNEFLPGQKAPSPELVAKAEAVRAKNRKVNKILIPVLLIIVILMVILIKITSK